MLTTAKAVRNVQLTSPKKVNSTPKKCELIIVKLSSSVPAPNARFLLISYHCGKHKGISAGPTSGLKSHTDAHFENNKNAADFTSVKVRSRHYLDFKLQA